MSGNSGSARETKDDMPKHTSAAARGGTGSGERMATSCGARRASAGPKLTLRDHMRCCPGSGRIPDSDHLSKIPDRPDKAGFASNNPFPQNEDCFLRFDFSEFMRHLAVVSDGVAPSI